MLSKFSVIIIYFYHLVRVSFTVSLSVLTLCMIFAICIRKSCEKKRNQKNREEKIVYHVLVSALFGNCFVCPVYREEKVDYHVSVCPVCWRSVAAAPEAMIIAVESMFAPAFGILSAVLTVIWLSRIFNDATLEITIVLSVVHLSYYICEFGPWPSLGSTACYTHERSRLISVAWCVSLGRSASCYTYDNSRLISEAWFVSLGRSASCYTYDNGRLISEAWFVSLGRSASCLSLIHI